MRRVPAVYPLLFTQIFSLIGSRMTGIAVGIHITPSLRENPQDVENYFPGSSVLICVLPCPTLC